jgi:alpha-tubulin suppressor-like RCC1 family protein
VTSISAGYSHALALLRDGSVLAWGSGLSGTGTSSLAVHQVVLVFVPGRVSGTLRR